MDKKSLLPWIEKYRPKTLSDLVAHDDIVSTINKLVEVKKLPHLLLYGPPGTGKTSTILAVARELYGENTKRMVLELNASDARGIDTVRNQIQTFAGTRTLFAPTTNDIKIVVLDEADNMTKDAQMALRRVIEKYSRHTRFCLICNYVSKIIPALQSRCTKFRFSPLNKEDIYKKLSEVASIEKLSITKEAKNSITTLAEGDMRRVLNLLQSSSLAIKEREITAEDIYSIAGKPNDKQLMTLYHKLLNDSVEKCVAYLQDLLRKGLAIEDMLRGLHPLVVQTDLPSQTKCFLLKELADLEERVSVATNEKIQLGGLVGCFVLSRSLAQKELGENNEEKMEVE